MKLEENMDLREYRFPFKSGLSFILFICLLSMAFAQVVTDDGCWWTTCKPLNTPWTGCPNNSVSKDVESCGGGLGNQYQCCSNVSGAQNEDLNIKNALQQGDGDGNLVPGAKCNKRMIGYYPAWGTTTFSSKQAQRLTHVVYAFVEMKRNGSIAVGNQNDEEESATATKRLQQLMRVAKTFSHLKIMFAVGGWINSQYFSAVAASPQKRLTFITSVIKNIDYWKFDGVDMDWENPVTGGAQEGIAADKQNYVQLMKEMREKLDQHAQAKGRSGNPYLLSFAGAADHWTLEPGYDLPGLLKYADWVNVMTYDLFGSGPNTGPPAPLYFGMPSNYSRKTNVEWTVKYYACRIPSPHQITMGVPFYGYYWKNVGPPVDGQDGMWRYAASKNDVVQVRSASWKEIKQKYIPNRAFEKIYHEKVQAPYAWNEAEKIFLGYENERSLKEKAKFAAKKNLGGLMVWAIDQDDSDISLLNSIYGADLCRNTNPKDVKFKCSPITEKRWWTIEDGADVAGLCGRSAPLYNGYYPVCNPDDSESSCCADFGYCGSGDKFCKCPNCVNYEDDPQKIMDRPSKPTIPVQWYFSNAPDDKRARCGRSAPKLNGKYPICNPDDKNAHCCSNGNYCGTGPVYCECEGCIDFAKNPTYKF